MSKEEYKFSTEYESDIETLQEQIAEYIVDAICNGELSVAKDLVKKYTDDTDIIYPAYEMISKRRKNIQIADEKLLSSCLDGNDLDLRNMIKILTSNKISYATKLIQFLILNNEDDENSNAIGTIAEILPDDEIAEILRLVLYNLQLDTFLSKRSDDKLKNIAIQRSIVNSIIPLSGQPIENGLISALASIVKLGSKTQIDEILQKITLLDIDYEELSKYL